MDPAEFVAAGLYDPTSPDAKERLALLRWLTDRGFTAVEIAEADADPGLPLEALASQQAVRQGQIHSRRESARLLGLSDSALERMLLASGYPNGDLDEAALTDMDITALRSFVTANEIFGEEPIEQFKMRQRKSYRSPLPLIAQTWTMSLLYFRYSYRELLKSFHRHTLAIRIH